MTAPSQAIVLAAGFGVRLRPLTDSIPKAMVRVGGRPLLDYSIDHARAAGAEKIIVNTHYCAGVIHDHLAGKSAIISYEKDILETGGGIFHVLPQFGGKAFYALNADSLWTEQGIPALRQMADAFDEKRMDGLLLLIPNDGHYADLSGDFFMEADGRLHRGKETQRPYIYIGAQILHPRLFDGAKPGKFSLNPLYDAAAARGRLYGVVARDISWFHISTPEDWRAADADFAKATK